MVAADDGARQGSAGADFWTDSTSVLFTSFWGWRPHEWATVGWSNDGGRSYRDNRISRLTDPFVTVIYVTRDPDGFDRDMVGKVAGFYLMSHEKGDRDEFTHPIHHSRHPNKWRHSLRALRAFSYISDPLLDAREVEPDIRTKGQAIASWGKVLRDPAQIARLRATPWREVALYQAGNPIDAHDDIVPPPGFVRAGPNAAEPYMVSPSAAAMPRRLYVLRLSGDIDAYLGEAAAGRQIIKIGLSISPESRRRDLQKGMPRGVYRWEIVRPAKGGGDSAGYTFGAAVAGEDAMKRYLAATGSHLGGEFYLATPRQVEEAWSRGNEAAQSLG